MNHYYQKPFNKNKSVWKVLFLSGLFPFLAETPSSAMQIMNKGKSGFNLGKTAQRDYVSQENLAGFRDAALANYMDFTRNKFGTLILNPNHLPKEDKCRKLHGFLKIVREYCPKQAVMVTLPMNNPGFYDTFEVLKNVGFTVHFADVDKTEMLFANGSPIPPPSTTTTVVRTVIMNPKGEILCIEDKNHPGNLMFAGGYVDPKELLKDTACREPKEEVNLVIEAKDLQILAMMNRTNANPYGASLLCFYYFTTKFQGDLKIQNEELNRAFWAKPCEIVKSNGADGLKPNPVTNTILKFLSENSKNSEVLSMPDPIRKDDLMTLNLFPVNTSNRE